MNVAIKLTVKMDNNILCINMQHHFYRYWIVFYAVYVNFFVPGESVIIRSSFIINNLYIMFVYCSHPLPGDDGRYICLHNNYIMSYCFTNKRDCISLAISDQLDQLV